MKDEEKTTVGRRDFPSQGRDRRGWRRCRRGCAFDGWRARRPETNDEKRKARYKETDHIKTYYRVNRYPG